MAEKPMTKAEVRYYLARVRQAVREAEAALKDGSAEDLRVAALEIGGCGGEIESALTADFEEPRGVRGLR